MWPRLRLDIGWLDLAAGLTALLGPSRLERREAAVRDAASGCDLVSLSARSAFDLVLQAAALPAGCEVLLSALTIEDMARVVEAHGLVPVPVDVDPDTLGPTPDGLQGACSPRARVLVVAHVFGGLAPLEPLSAFARERGLLLVEDRAQAFAADGDAGHPEADVTLFSFGTIKTATALGGGLARIRDTALAARARGLQAGHPVQRRRPFAAKLAKAALLKLLGMPPLYGACVHGCRLLGRDLDGVLHGAVRGFPQEGLLAALRRRPCGALLALLERRLRTYPRERIGARAAVGDTLTRALPPADRLAGGAALRRTHWVFPVLTPDPRALVARLRRAGFDATRRSSMTVLPRPPGSSAPEPMAARAALERLVFVPCDPDLSSRRVKRLSACLAEARVGEPLSLST